MPETIFENDARSRRGAAAEYRGKQPILPVKKPVLRPAQDGAASRFREMDGVVKWFCPIKGFGFLGADLEDIYLHLACLLAYGLETVPRGAKIRCDVHLAPRGLMAVRIKSVDMPSAEEPPASVRHIAAAESPWVTANVKWFDSSKGYGFLTCGEGTPDIFVHMETLRRSNFAALEPDQRVLVQWGRGDDNRRIAAKLRPAE